jgi:hypothetical protein
MLQGTTVKHTRVTIQGDAWLINERPAYAERRYRGWKIERLLLNSRMVQAIFDDENPITRIFWKYPDTAHWDAERNAREFVSAMPAWRAHGLLGITVNLQGGSPLGYYRPEAVEKKLKTLGIEASEETVWAGLPGKGSQPYDNSVFDEAGRLKQPYLERLTWVLDKADERALAIGKRREQSSTLPRHVASQLFCGAPRFHHPRGIGGDLPASVPEGFRAKPTGVAPRLLLGCRPRPLRRLRATSSPRLAAACLGLAERHREVPPSVP